MHALLAAATGAMMTGLAAWSLGRACFRVPWPWPLHFAAGSALLSVAVFGLLAVHAAKPGVFVAVASVCVAAGCIRRIEGREPRFEYGRWLAVGAAPFLALYAVAALAPEIQPDSLNYHLSIPIQARIHGGFPPGRSFFELVPQGMETLFAMAYSIGRDSGAKLLSLAYLVATVPLMLHAGSLLGLPAAVCRMAALFYFVTPVVGAVGSCTYNDTALAFFSLAAMCLLLEMPWASGLCAGFCYAIKFTGGLLGVAGFVALLARRRWPELARFTAGAALVAVPWLVRNAWLTGNPFAPLMNQLFLNPYFHIETEQKLSQFLRSYGGADWVSIPGDLAIHGDTLQGLLGPAWLLVPVALLALRTNAGRWLWLGATVCLLPWLLNLGARFTIPALPFVALALFAVLPRPAGIAVAALHAVLSLPPVTNLYAAPHGWRLREAPWRVALGLEPREAYRKRVSLQHNLAQLLKDHTSRGDRILDLADAPAAISERNLINNWQTALGDGLLRSVINASISERWPLFEWRASAPAQPVRAVRIMLKEVTPEPWAVHEIRLGTVTATRSWSLAATGNVDEAPLAADGNLTTFWSTWDQTGAGTSVELIPPAPVAVGEIRVVTSRPEGQEIQILTDSWKAVPTTGPALLPKMNLRFEAIRAVKREGIRYVLAKKGTDPMGKLGLALGDAPRNWGLTLLGTYEFFSLYRVD